MNKSYAFLIIATCANIASAQVYNHDPASPIGPNHWGTIAFADATCGDSILGPVGLKQSPINIVTSSVVPGLFTPLLFGYKPTTETVENTGHYIEVVYDSGSTLLIGPNPSDSYNLAQFHFHAPAEHTIDGFQADAEMHLVHTNALGDTAVVAVLLVSSPTGLDKFTEIMNTAPDVANEEAVGPTPVNVLNLLPALKGFYTYSGSLTTPPCTEGVRFFVMKNPVPIKPAALNRLHALISDFPNYGHYPNNNRPVLPLGSRTVLKTFY
jgi:carbonic anhydrase